ncbi:hypothetical protein JOC95_002204 [Bacillus tianshenii]|uniref:Uncharacterized protein n=1 Tax=Sutcliffiella tianshenii TaxID=1463404 RepID=A0ABS2P055_9BACI|nr:hypothetical protein [Bacillus tianshenii]
MVCTHMAHVALRLVRRHALIRHIDLTDISEAGSTA